MARTEGFFILRVNALWCSKSLRPLKFVSIIMASMLVVFIEAKLRFTLQRRIFIIDGVADLCRVSCRLYALYSKCFFAIRSDAFGLLLCEFGLGVSVRGGSCFFLESLFF